jgi:hypothetical protein
MPRLEPDQIVDVCLAGGWRRTVRVVAVGDAHVDVLPIDGPAGLPAGIELWQATIEWRAERGLARAEGVITDTSDALRFLETAGEVVMQRRRFFRVRCGVTVTVAGADRDPTLTEAVDLSVGGMLLARADSLRIGDRVRFGRSEQRLRADQVLGGVDAQHGVGVLPFDVGDTELLDEVDCPRRRVEVGESRQGLARVARAQWLGDPAAARHRTRPLGGVDERAHQRVGDERHVAREHEQLASRRGP